MATTIALFEPFRNPVTVSEVRSCLSKLLDVQAECDRLSRKGSTRYNEAELPKLWILTPTASLDVLQGFHAFPDEEKWPTGIYSLGEYLRTAVVVIHKLPKTAETLWLRILGRKGVQQEAIAQLSALPVDEPLRINTLELVYQLQSNLAANREQQELEAEDQELIMAIRPLFQEQLAAAKQEGIQEGIAQGVQQGVQQGQRLIVGNFLQGRWGELSQSVAVMVDPLSALPSTELTRLLLELSQLGSDALAIQQGQRLAVETLLKFYLGELDEQMMPLVDSLLLLSPQQLREVLLKLPSLSRNELLGLLAELLGD